MVYRAKYPHTETKINFYMMFFGERLILQRTVSKGAG